MRCLRASLAAVVVWVGIADSLVGQGEGTPAGPAKQVARVDFNGDPLPDDALVRIGSVRLRHGHEIKDVAFSPDGKTFASAGHDHAVRLWDAATGRELRRFAMEAERTDVYSYSRWMSSVAFSPDGKRLACGEFAGGWPSNKLRVWNVATGKLLFMSEGARGGMPAVAFSPDGGIVASAGIDGTINLWDGATGAARLRMTGHQGPVRSVAWSPKGNILATTSDDQTIRLWDPTTGRTIRPLVGHQAPVESVHFSPDGQSLVSGSRDKTLRLWDVATGKGRGVLGQHEKAVLRVAFAPDGTTVASASADRTIKLWDVAGGKMAGVFEGHQLDVRGISFSPDGKTLASASDDQKVCLWDVKTRKEVHPQPGHQESAIALGFLKGGNTLVSLSRDDTIRWWDWKKGKQERSIAWQKIFPPRATAFSPDDTLLAVGTLQGGIRLLDAESGKELDRLEHGNRPIAAVTFSSDGQTLGSADGAKVLLWDVATRKVVKRLPEEFLGIELVLFAPNGKLLMGGNQSSYLWDVAKDKLVHKLELSIAQFKSAAFTPDSRILACGDTTGNVTLWDVEAGEKTRVLTGLVGYVMVLSMSPDSRLLAGGGWRGIKVWEIETGLERRAFHDFEGDAYSVAFSPDGRTLASGVDGQQILVWDVPGKKAAIDPKAAAGSILPGLWKDLASADGGRVHRAIWGLAGRPAEAVPYLRTMLEPVVAVNGPHLAQLIKDLDSDLFAVREKATKEIQNMGERAEMVLRTLYLEPPSLEVKRRAKSLLEELAAPLASSERLRKFRAIEALERMGSPDARALLQELARGAMQARFTRESIASLERLSKQPLMKP